MNSLNLFVLFVALVCKTIFIKTHSIPLVEFMYLVFTHMAGESYCRRLKSLLLCLCDVFLALINSLVLVLTVLKSDLL